MYIKKTSLYHFFQRSIFEGIWIKYIDVRRLSHTITVESLEVSFPKLKTANDIINGFL